MKKIFFLFVLFISGAELIISCRKPTLPEHRAPVALAGPDQVITLPTDSISLDGSSSHDPDDCLEQALSRLLAKPNQSLFFNKINKYEIGN